MKNIKDSHLLYDKRFCDDLVRDRPEVNCKDLCVILDASKMKSVNSMHEQFVSGFSFPSYYGHNFSALNDCMTDLEWLNFDSITLIIVNSFDLLIEEDNSVRSCLLAYMKDICRYWDTPINDGEWWDREAIHCKVVFDRDCEFDEGA
ncbi:MAG: barstar family protein [Candidatus Cloacimonetes bacterium]|nr:barstar family protein [Candidatus Cloacimonadota bacterium]